MDYIPLSAEVHRPPRAPFWSSSSASFWKRVLLVVVLSIVVDVLCFRLFEGEPLQVVASALGTAQIAVLAMWLGMSRKWISGRVFALLIVAALWAPFSGGEIASGRQEIAGARGYSLVLAYVIVPLLLLRLCGLQVIVVCKQGQSDGRIAASRPQFSVAQILDFTAAVAIVAGLFKCHFLSLEMYNPDGTTELVLVVVYPMIAAINLWAAWAILGRRILVRLAVIGAIGLATVWLIPGVPPQMLYVILALLPFRLLGYRIHWRWAKDRSRQGSQPLAGG